MQTEQSIFIMKNLLLLNNKKISMSGFIRNMYSTIKNVISNISYIDMDRDDILSMFVEHLLEKGNILHFEYPGKFCAYIKMFAINSNLTEIKQKRRFVDFDVDLISGGSNILSNEGDSLNAIILIKNTGLTITELSKRLSISKNTIDNYIKDNVIPINIKARIEHLKGFHNPIDKAIQLSKRVNSYANVIKDAILTDIGINNAFLLKICREGIPYTRFKEIKDELDKLDKIYSAKNIIEQTGLTITELSQILNISRQIIYSYIDENNIPSATQLKLLELKEFHNPIERAIELKEMINSHFGHLKEDAFKKIGVNRTYLFKACNKGISYTQYIKINEKLLKYKQMSL